MSNLICPVLAVLDCLFIGHLRVLAVTTVHSYRYNGLGNLFYATQSRQQLQIEHVRLNIITLLAKCLR